MSETPDYSDEVQEPELNIAQELHALVRQQIAAADEVTRLEEELKAAKEKYNNISQVQIPNFMLEQVGMDEFRIAGGPKVVIKKTIRASLPKDPEARGKAFAWLEGNGHANLIKDEIDLSFGKGDHARAEAVVKLLETNGYDYGRKLDIHNQTLCKFLRETLADGEHVPLELFGAFEQKTAEIKF